MTVGADSKWNNVGDLIAAAKANPDGLTYGSSGIGGTLHLGPAMMEKATGTKMRHIPYKETPQIYLAVGSGDVSWAMGTGSTTLPMYKANKIKYLAVAAPKRTALYPNVPTVAEAGGPANFELQTWVSMFAPHGTPKPIIAKINADIARVLQDPEVKERLAAVGFEPLIQSPDELAKMMAKDAQTLGAVVKDANIALD